MQYSFEMQYSLPDFISEEDFAEHIIRLINDTSLYECESPLSITINQSIVLAEHYNYDEKIFISFIKYLTFSDKSAETATTDIIHFIDSVKDRLPQNIIIALEDFKLKIDLLK